MLKLEMIPLLGLKEGSFWAYLNVPEDKAEGQKATPNLATMEDDPPF